MLVLALAACRAHPHETVSQVVDKPAGVQLVVGDRAGVRLIDLEGHVLETWSTKPTGDILGALPGHRGVVAMTSAGDVRIVRPGEDRVIAQVGMQVACGAEGAAALSVKSAHLSADGRAACVGLAMPPRAAVVIEATVDLLAKQVYTRWTEPVADCRMMVQAPPPALRCPPPARPLVKTIEIEGDAFTLVSVSPTKRWELYTGPTRTDEGDVAPLLFVDTVAKQRYAPDTGDWPPALQPGRKVATAWPANPQVTWFADDLARVDQHALVELGKRVSLPGSFVRW